MTNTTDEFPYDLYKDLAKKLLDVTSVLTLNGRLTTVTLSRTDYEKAMEFFTPISLYISLVAKEAKKKSPPPVPPPIYLQARALLLSTSVNAYMSEEQVLITFERFIYFLENLQHPLKASPSEMETCVKFVWFFSLIKNRTK